MFVVKAHHEDALGTVVGHDGNNLSVELSDEDDDLLGDADARSISTIPWIPTRRRPGAYAWVFTIDEGRHAGDHMITVSTTKMATVTTTRTSTTS